MTGTLELLYTPWLFTSVRYASLDHTAKMSQRDTKKCPADYNLRKRGEFLKAVHVKLWSLSFFYALEDAAIHWARLGMKCRDLIEEKELYFAHSKMFFRENWQEI